MEKKPFLRRSTKYFKRKCFEENILKRGFKAETINQKWVTNITYIYVLGEGWTYMASVMILYDRKIIDYAYDKNMTADLALDAVRNAYIEFFHSVMKKEGEFIVRFDIKHLSK